MTSRLSILVLCALVGLTLAHSMFYKKKENDRYEPDLVPVSSTVIPLSVYEASVGIGPKSTEEYKIAFLKKLRKKVKHEDDYEDPDTLITIKSKHHANRKTKDAQIKAA